MIDQLREQIQKRLDELTAEADRLRDALTALGHRAVSAAEQTARSHRPTVTRPARARRSTNGAAPSAAEVRAPARRAGTPKSAAPATVKATEAASEKDNGKTAPAARAAKGRTARTTAARPTAARPTTARAASGATKQAVLAALAAGDAMTAGQVAEKAGLARPTVSTTLTKLVKSGEVNKAARGYQIATHVASASAEASTGPKSAA